MKTPLERMISVVGDVNKFSNEWNESTSFSKLFSAIETITAFIIARFGSRRGRCSKDNSCGFPPGVVEQRGPLDESCLTTHTIAFNAAKHISKFWSPTSRYHRELNYRQLNHFQLSRKIIKDFVVIPLPVDRVASVFTLTLRCAVTAEFPSWLLDKWFLCYSREHKSLWVFIIMQLWILIMRDLGPENVSDVVFQSAQSRMFMFVTTSRERWWF